MAAAPSLGELKSTTVDGARLAYLEAGPVDGEPVVLVHGDPANHRSSRHQIPALAETHRVLALDLIGWGHRTGRLASTSTTTPRSAGAVERWMKPELRQGLAQIACPTTVIWGRRDVYLPYAIADELGTEIPNCGLTIIDDAGHFVMEERP